MLTIYRGTLVAMLLAIFAASALPQNGHGSLAASASQLRKPLQLNGDLSRFRRMPAIHLTSDSRADPARSATIFLGWDKAFFYLAFHVFSPGLQATVRQRDGNDLWKDDGVEFLIDPTQHRTKQFTSTDFSYHINILNSVYDDRGTLAGVPDEKWNGDARHFVRVIDQHQYVVEVAVPWSEIGLTPAVGMQLEMDLCINGRNPKTKEYEYIDWAGLTNFHDPSGYGKITLISRSRDRHKVEHIPAK